jgi:transposase InsO family protein
MNIYHRKLASTEKSNITTTGQKISWTDWHKRYGHISISGLQQLLAYDLVDGLNIDKDSAIRKCEPCIKARQEHTPFPQQSESRAQFPGELTHTDVCGPITPTSWSGMRFNINFIDDNTRNCTSAQMKTKGEASHKLRQYLIYIKLQFGYSPKRLRLDKGGEYFTNEFQNWCAENGIAIESTAPYSPSQNGVAERFNRTLIELSRAMLFAHDIPQSLWPEAINHAAYV